MERFQEEEGVCRSISRASSRYPAAALGRAPLGRDAGEAPQRDEADAAGWRRYAGICGASDSDPTTRRRRCWPCRTGRRHGLLCFRAVCPKGLGSSSSDPIGVNFRQLESGVG